MTASAESADFMQGLPYYHGLGRGHLPRHSFSNASSSVEAINKRTQIRTNRCGACRTAHAATQWAKAAQTRLNTPPYGPIAGAQGTICFSPMPYRVSVFIAQRFRSKSKPPYCTSCACALNIRQSPQSTQPTLPRSTLTKQICRTLLPISLCDC